MWKKILWFQIKELSITDQRARNIRERSTRSIKFRNINNKFQNLIKVDTAKVKASSNVFIPAGKTTNMYELSPTGYKKSLKDNITRTYKKATPRLEDAINLEAKEIAKCIKLGDKTECAASFIRPVLRYYIKIKILSTIIFLQIFLAQKSQTANSADSELKQPKRIRFSYLEESFFKFLHISLKLFEIKVLLRLYIQIKSHTRK